MDRASETNENSNWVNLRGSWLVHCYVLIFIRVALAIIPGISAETSWTLTNVFYNMLNFLMFHWVSGTPFNMNQGEYEELTLWEQLDDGQQFTPSRKFLTALPIGLFLISTHFTHYNFGTFMINLTSLLVIIIAKLPAMHKVRLFGIKQQ